MKSLLDFAVFNMTPPAMGMDCIKQIQEELRVLEICRNDSKDTRM